MTVNEVAKKICASHRQWFKETLKGWHLDLDKLSAILVSSFADFRKDNLEEAKQVVKYWLKDDLRFLSIEEEIDKLKEKP